MHTVHTPYWLVKHSKFNTELIDLLVSNVQSLFFLVVLGGGGGVGRDVSGLFVQSPHGAINHALYKQVLLVYRFEYYRNGQEPFIFRC